MKKIDLIKQFKEGYKHYQESNLEEEDRYNSLPWNNRIVNFLRIRGLIENGEEDQEET